MQTRPLLISIFIILLMVFAVPACTSAQVTPDVPPTATVSLTSSPGPTAAATGILNYALSWQTDSVTFLPDGGWQLTTNLGYDVIVERGYITNFRIEMLECETETSALDWLRPATVLAGHPSDGPSETRTAQDLVENIANPTPQSMASLPVSLASWCNLHYLAGPASDIALNLPTDIDQRGNSIWIVGQYKAPDSDTWQPFEATSTEGFGNLLTLNDGAGVKLGEGVVSIVLTRDLATLFDNADFATLAPDTLGFSVLRQLNDNLHVTINQ